MTINAINSKSEIHEKLRPRTIVLHTTVGRFACLELDVLALLFYASLKHLLQMRCRLSLTLADVSQIMPYFSRYVCFKAVNISKSTCTLPVLCLYCHENCWSENRRHILYGGKD